MSTTRPHGGNRNARSGNHNGAATTSSNTNATGGQSSSAATTTSTTTATDGAATSGSGSEHKPILAERFKTKLCKNFVTKGVCPYTHRCMFAHGDDDMRSKEQNMTDGLTTEDAIKHFQRTVLSPQMSPSSPMTPPATTNGPTASSAARGATPTSLSSPSKAKVLPPVAAVSIGTADGVTAPPTALLPSVTLPISPTGMPESRSFDRLSPGLAGAPPPAAAAAAATSGGRRYSNTSGLTSPTVMTPTLRITPKCLADIMLPERRKALLEANERLAQEEERAAERAVRATGSNRTTPGTRHDPYAQVPLGSPTMTGLTAGPTSPNTGPLAVPHRASAATPVGGSSLPDEDPDAQDGAEITPLKISRRSSSVAV